MEPVYTLLDRALQDRLRDALCEALEEEFPEYSMVVNQRLTECTLRAVWEILRDESDQDPADDDNEE